MADNISAKGKAEEAVFFRQARALGRVAPRSGRAAARVLRLLRASLAPARAARMRAARRPTHARTTPLPTPQKDEQLLKGLLNKEKAAAGGGPPPADPAADEAALRAILGKYDVSDADIALVMKWKRG
jgi:hypothetical protein